MSNSQIPLVLAGPIVRRVAADGVTVWLALSRATGVTLTVTRGDAEVVASGVATPIELGERLHVVAVTARPVAAALPWGAEYSYDLAFEGVGTLGTDGVLGPDGAAALAALTYGRRALPSLRLAAGTRDGLVLAHGSCRKPHGLGRDALALLDATLDESIRLHRGAPPQALFLTGDQIYADDVATGVLRRIVLLKKEILGQDTQAERAPFDLGQVPTWRTPGVDDTVARPELHLLRRRAWLVKTMAGFSTGNADNHLLTFAEYALMYLLAWSDVPWRIAGAAPTREDEPRLTAFFRDLPKVRRVLANVPTWMIFDDHEVTDDWNRAKYWVNDVGASTLGRQVVLNALAAYAVFQHWGNVPERFEGVTPGRALLEAIPGWLAGAKNETTTVEGTIFVPQRAGETVQGSALRWSWTAELGACRVHAPDCRTRRGYGSLKDRPALLVESARDELFRQGGVTGALDVLLLPTPILGEEMFDEVQNIASWAARKLKLRVAEGQLEDLADCETWRGDLVTWRAMLEGLAGWRQVVILSGDVHYAYAATLCGGGVHIVNFTSSALKNRAFKKSGMWLLDAIEGLHGSDLLRTEATPPGPRPLRRGEPLHRPGARQIGARRLHESLVDMEVVAPPPGSPGGGAFPDGGLLRGDVLGEPNVGVIRFTAGQVPQHLLYRDPEVRRLRRELIHRVALPSP